MDDFAEFADGEALFRAVERYGLEGIVAKPLDSPYQPGERSDRAVNSPCRRCNSV